MLRIIYLLIGTIVLSGCKPEEAAEERVDYEDLFDISTINIPVEDGMDLLIFEHLSDSGWDVMHSNEIPEKFRSDSLPFRWMLGLSGEIEVIYGLPNFRGGYRLPNGKGKLEISDLSKDSEGRYTLFFRRVGDELTPCVRVSQTTSKK